MEESLVSLLAQRDNDYKVERELYEGRTYCSWEAPAPLREDLWSPLTIIIPVRNMEYAIDLTLNAITRSIVCGPLQIIVIDDASIDSTLSKCLDHPAKPTVVHFSQHRGVSIARNVGIHLAIYSRLLFLDADIVLTPWSLLEHSLRGLPNTICVGFRDSVFINDPRIEKCGLIPETSPSIEGDIRVCWRAPAGKLLYSGEILESGLEIRALEATNELHDLGFGRLYYEWDLPRMVVTANMSVDRQVAINVGGFDSIFSNGWGMEDTHFGAKLIAQGLKVLPLRHSVGFHVESLDRAEQWKRKFSSWPHNIGIYKSLRDHAPDKGALRRYVTETQIALADAYIF